MLAQREEIDVLDQDDLVIVVLEDRLVQDLLYLFAVPRREKLVHSLYPFGRLDQASRSGSSPISFNRSLTSRSIILLILIATALVDTELWTAYTPGEILDEHSKMCKENLRLAERRPGKVGNGKDQADSSRPDSWLSVR